MTIYLPLLVALIGLVIYALSATKAAEIGRIMFWTGLLVFLMYLGAGHVVKLP